MDVQGTIRQAHGIYLEGAHRGGKFFFILYPRSARIEFNSYPSSIDCTSARSSFHGLYCFSFIEQALLRFQLIPGVAHYSNVGRLRNLPSTHNGFCRGSSTNLRSFFVFHLDNLFCSLYARPHEAGSVICRDFAMRANNQISARLYPFELFA
ncbi:hypothetical protein BDV27DRAFT_106776 [Aspergillus caelatus]|uniref:Uncharacterized protein n=1 Tax=Aspergillus caelatus TaxID=61420 RepID=A0A5N7A7X8_9EURO|nr:uncharacterized protein BDV27DRAFT_106776 [Aspergillus caelatus]KAE8365239.1 hypothetical protein BDV27DRAFT_106776 [Aspergillus caelatus]